MPVRDLAPALLALGEIFSESGKLLYPDRPPVSLNIRATDEGSFLVQLLLEGERAWDQFVDVFSADSIDALANLKELVIRRWRWRTHRAVLADKAPKEPKSDREGTDCYAGAPSYHYQ